MARACHWVDELKGIFEEAIILKQKMESADDATYEYVWTNGGALFDRQSMENVYGPDANRVLVTLLPPIRATETDKVTLQEEISFVSPSHVVSRTERTALPIASIHPLESRFGGYADGIGRWNAKAGYGGQFARLRGTVPQRASTYTDMQ